VRARPGSSLRSSAAFIASLVLYATYAIGAAKTLTSRLSYPPGMDQDLYLAAGRDFVDGFVFLWRSPLYSAWMGIIYWVSGQDLKNCFYAEKIASVFFLSVLVGWLGWLLFDKWTGLLLAFWVLNCKYLLLETNSSHALAACVLVLSGLCLYLPNKSIRLPAALSMLLLSTQFRSEMWVPLFATAIYLAARQLRAWIRHRRLVALIDYAVLPSWLAAIVPCVGLLYLVSFRVSNVEPQRLTVAFKQNFAVNYVERYQMFSQFPDPWSQWPAIWASALPGASRPVDALVRYPGEFFQHVLYNLRLCSRSFPANVLASDRPLLVGLTLIAYFSWYFRLGLDRSLRSSLSHPALVVIACSMGLLIPISLALRVAVRYYIQLIPVQLIIMVLVGRGLINRLRKSLDNPSG